MSCIPNSLLLGHGDSGRLTLSRQHPMFRPNARIRAGVVETTRDVKKGRLAKRIRNVVSKA
jgi:hypothetical protein